MKVSLLRSTLVLSLAAIVFSPGVSGQVAETLDNLKPKSVRDRIDKVDHAERMKRIAITGDLGFPALPPVYWDSPRDDLQYIDRFPFGEQPVSAADGGTPAALDGFIPSGPTGTGTTVPEIFKYLLPPGYEIYQPGLPPIPLVFAYHGYGSSANSVAVLSQIDDECYERGWAYFAPTGMDDQLFGSPLCIQNVEAALAWMLEHFNIDPERIYLVGFSMGGGIVTNYAARHRDPNGTMVAALGIVSGTFDWTMTWKLGSTSLKTLMQSSFNFSGPANNSTYKFNYQRASGLYYSYASYPPLGGPAVVPLETSCLAANLATIPTYITWDTDDTLPEVVQQENQMWTLVQSLGGTVEYHTTTGTIHPINGLPAPHSWAVLDEDALFDFFEGKVADRTPDSFHAVMAESGDVSWLSLTQEVSNAFSIVDGIADAEIPSVQLSNVLNADAIHLDMNTLGFNIGQPVRVNAGATGGEFELMLTGFDDPPAYLIDAVTGDLVLGTESDPLADTLLQPVSSAVDLNAIVVTDPTWSTDLYTGPNPVAIGSPLTLDIDAPATSALSLLFVGFTQALGTISGGYHITLQLGPPTIFVELPLDLDGDASLAANMPNDAVLSGMTLLLQSVSVGVGGVDSISNLWALHVQ
jgi:acetyl esterase/lipase